MKGLQFLDEGLQFFALKMKIVVAGANGKLGLLIVRELLALKVTTVALVRSANEELAVLSKSNSLLKVVVVDYNNLDHTIFEGIFTSTLQKACIPAFLVYKV